MGLKYPLMGGRGSLPEFIPIRKNCQVPIFPGIDCPGQIVNPFWHERAAFQRSVFGRLTAVNDVVATILFPLLFPQSQPFLIERVLGPKNLFCES